MNCKSDGYRTQTVEHRKSTPNARAKGAGQRGQSDNLLIRFSSDRRPATLADYQTDPTPAGNVILTFAYSDSSVEGWPKSPDGDGTSLVLKRPFHASTDPGLPDSWRPSTATGGAPGQLDSTIFSGNPTADADGDGYTALVEYALGTRDDKAESIPQLAMVRDAQGRLQINTSHPATADDVVIDALESSNLKDWNAIGLQEQVPVANSAQYRRTWQSTTSGPNVFVRLRVRQN